MMISIFYLTPIFQSILPLVFSYVDQVSSARVKIINIFLNIIFSAKLYETHKMDFLNLYGFDKLPYLLQLEENKLIKVQSSDKSKFKDHLIKTMKLTEKNRDIFNPANSSYVFDSLWNPITTKLVHEAVSGKF